MAAGIAPEPIFVHGVRSVRFQQQTAAAKYRIDDPPDVLRFLTALADVRTPARLRPNG